MNLDNAMNLKSELISQNYREITADPGERVRPNGLRVPSAPGKQLSVGFSRRGIQDYHLEVRLANAAGSAHRAAQKVKAQAEKEVHIGILDSLRVPPLETLIESAKETAQDATFCDHKRPLHIGLSVGHVNGGAGTLGAFVEDSAGRAAILSNCHVLALTGQGRSKDWIYQPGKQDVPSETLLGSHEIGTLENYTTFSEAGANYLDGAYALLKDGVEPDPDGNTIPGPCPGAGTKIRDVIDYSQLGPNQIVCKIGRTSGCTFGVVNGFGIDDVVVDIPPLGKRRFDDLLEVLWGDKPFAKGGDSGSLVFLADRPQAVGLHFAGGSLRIDGKRVGVSYACSLSRLLEIFHLTFL
jgi:hypothetical protein